VICSLPTLGSRATIVLTFINEKCIYGNGNYKISRSQTNFTDYGAESLYSIVHKGQAYAIVQVISENSLV